MQDISNTFGAKVHELKQDPSNQPLGQQVSAAAHEKNAARKVVESEPSSQQQLNQAILQANADVSISAGNQPMALLFKSAIEGINDVLGENTIQDAYDSGLDVSPEATAERIVSLSTAFYPSYKEQHPELTEEEAATKFTDLISGGIDQGFAEAREILSGLNVLEGDIASNIDKTYDLVQAGLQSFLESYAPNDAEEPEASQDITGTE
ncbi:MAG: DUF5610 domain-containing protein [Methyloprofundus sp.]|nr:DUF5610 domain-containing protein [Methyloprofundus sp.]